MTKANLRSWAAAGLTAMALVLAPVTATAETLTDALIAAYRNSNLLDQNRALLRAADEDVAQAVASLRPVVEFGASATYRHAERLETRTLPTTPPVTLSSRQTRDSLTSTIGITADMLLLDFGRTEAAINAAKEAVLATREGLVAIEMQVLLDAVRAYMDVRLQEEIVALRQSNVRVITQERRAAQDRFDVGEVTRTDVSLAEARLAQARANLVAAEGDLAVAREQYKAVTGAYPGRLSAPPRTPALAKSVEEAKAVARRMHPTIRRLQHEVAANEFNVARAASNMKPTLGARAQIGMDQDGFESQSLTLNFNQTLYSGGNLASLQRQAIARRDAARAALLQSVVEVEQAVGNAWSSLSVAAASIEASDRQIRASQTAYDGVREEAKLGARTTLDVLNAEQDLLDARANRLTAEAQRYVAVYAVLASMGLLTADHLKLGVPNYDPAAYYNSVKNAPAHSPQGKKLDRILKSIGGN